MLPGLLSSRKSLSAEVTVGTLVLIDRFVVARFGVAKAFRLR